jgi:hypothetical protein
LPDLCCYYNKDIIISDVDRILYIYEVEAIIFNNLYPLVDFKALTLVNHYYHQIINQNNLYIELKSFCLNQQTELKLLYYRHALFFLIKSILNS